MESKAAAPATWKYSVLYLTIICTLIYFLHQNQIFQKLLVNHDQIYLKKFPDLPLRFRSDGTFKILQVADMHYGNGRMTRCRDVLDAEFEYCSDLNTTRFLRRIIQAERPDFIAFTGDNIFGTSTTDAAESLFGAFGPAIEAGLPWAAVLGNHDQKSSMNRRELMDFISLMDYSLAQTNPQDLEDDIDGFGNYDLKVYGPPGSNLANSSILNLFFLDSGDRENFQGVQTYGWIKESQLRWLRGVSQGQKQISNVLEKSWLTSLAFFHIPIPEIKQLHNQKITGQFQQPVSCSMANSGVLQTLMSIKGVKAVFVGHDHTNDFCGKLEGVWFCYAGGFGYHGYGKPGWLRRARVIKAEVGKLVENFAWKINGVEKIKTWKLLDDEKLTIIDEQLLWETQPLERD